MRLTPQKQAEIIAGCGFLLGTLMIILFAYEVGSFRWVP